MSVSNTKTVSEKLCKYCDQKAVYNTSCRKCSELYNKLMNFQIKKTVIDDVDMYPDYLIRITYDVYSQSHSGYCSDEPEHVKVENSKETRVFPLIRKIKNKHIQLDNTINISEKPLKYYIIHSLPNCHCGSGNIIHRITSATVFRRSDMITLDD